MSRLQTLFERYIQARADVDASNAEVRRASARRLAELLASSDRSALVAGVSDPTLTTYDRQQLEHAIADRMPRRRRQEISITIGRIITLSLRHACYNWRVIAFLAVFVSLVGIFGFVARCNTPAQEAFFSQGWKFVWQDPDGHTQTISISAGTGVVAMPASRAGRVALRLWDPGLGYLITEVPVSWLVQNASVWNARSTYGW